MSNAHLHPSLQLALVPSLLRLREGTAVVSTSTRMPSRLKIFFSRCVTSRFCVKTAEDLSYVECGPFETSKPGAERYQFLSFETSSDIGRWSEQLEVEVDSSDETS